MLVRAGVARGVGQLLKDFGLRGEEKRTLLEAPCHGRRDLTGHARLSARTLGFARGGAATDIGSPARMTCRLGRQRGSDAALYILYGEPRMKYTGRRQKSE